MLMLYRMAFAYLVIALHLGNSPAKAYLYNQDGGISLSLFRLVLCKAGGSTVYSALFNCPGVTISIYHVYGTALTQLLIFRFP